MVFTAASRAAIAVHDPSYLVKLQLRGALTLLSLVSLACLASVVCASSNFQSPAWKRDTHAWPCLPLIVITLIWNVINFAVLAKWKRPLNPLINLVVHGILTLLFIILGGVATHAAASALSIVDSDPYVLPSGKETAQVDRGYQLKADNGSMVTVTADSVSSCPAFASCAAQDAWMHMAQHRAAVAVAGCAIFFLCLPLHLLLTMLFIRDYKIRLANNKETDSVDFQPDPSAPTDATSKHPYGNPDMNGTFNTVDSQVHLIKERHGGMSHHKPWMSQSGASVSTDRPQTAKTTTTTGSRRPRWNQRKSFGPSLPLFSLSRTSSMTSTIASRRSAKRALETNKDLPPVPLLKPEHRASAGSIATKELGSPISLLPPKEINVYPARSSSLSYSTLARTTALKSPKSPKLLPKAMPEFPKMAPEPPTTPRPPTGAEARRKPSTERPLSPVGDPADRGSFDYRQPELTALPEGAPKLSFQDSRPASPLGDLDLLRSLTGTLFGLDSGNGSRTSFMSSGCVSSMYGGGSSSGGGGRLSPWRERAERKAFEAEMARERLERERQLLEAESKAHRAAEKLESAYLRDEMARLEEKEAMRRQKIEDRLKRLKETLEELKRVQDEEEARQKDREEQDRKEEEEFQEELRSIIGSRGNGKGPGVHMAIAHARAESYSVGKGRVVEQRARSREPLKDRQKMPDEEQTAISEAVARGCAVIEKVEEPKAQWHNWERAVS